MQVVLHAEWQAWSAPQVWPPGQSLVWQQAPLLQRPPQPAMPGLQFVFCAVQQMEAAPQGDTPLQPLAHAPFMHSAPAPQSASTVHRVHWFLTHTCPPLQSAEVQQVPE